MGSNYWSCKCYVKFILAPREVSKPLATTEAPTLAPDVTDTGAGVGATAKASVEAGVGASATVDDKAGVDGARDGALAWFCAANSAFPAPKKGHV